MRRVSSVQDGHMTWSEVGNHCCSQLRVRIVAGQADIPWPAVLLRLPAPFQGHMLMLVGNTPAPWTHAPVLVDIEGS